MTIFDQNRFILAQKRFSDSFFCIFKPKNINEFRYIFFTLLTQKKYFLRRYALFDFPRQQPYPGFKNAFFNLKERKNMFKIS